MRKLVAIAGLVCATLAAAGWAASRWTMTAASTAGAREAPAAQVVIDNFTFSTQTLTIKTGTAVKWVNRDDVPHTIVSEDKRFKSPVLDTDETFSHTFAAPGTYSYYCSIHPRMVGKVVVR